MSRPGVRETLTLPIRPAEVATRDAVRAAFAAQRQAAEDAMWAQYRAERAARAAKARDWAQLT